jgi:PadR family transcriptional regulator, regulatory protein AphA
VATTRVNPTEFAILGLLAESPRSGYDIKLEVEGRLKHFWHESFGHIYPMLQRLQRRRLISVRAVAGTRGRPERKVYSITAAGRRALTAWFSEPPAASRPRNELLLRLFLGKYAPPGMLIRDVRAYGAMMHGALERLREVEARLAADPNPPRDAVFWRLTVSFGTQLYETLAEWSEMADRELRRLED